MVRDAKNNLAQEEEEDIEEMQINLTSRKTSYFQNNPLGSIDDPAQIVVNDKRVSERSSEAYRK